METTKKQTPKPWYKSKAILGGAGLIVLALFYAGGCIPEERLAKIVELVLEGYALIGIRTARRPVG